MQCLPHTCTFCMLLHWQSFISFHIQNHSF